MAIPSFRVIFLFVAANAHTNTENPTRIIISIRFSVKILIGLIAEAIPSTIKILKILDPTAFPTAISTSSFLAATMDVTSSGSDVPIETMVSPTSVWLIPSSMAIRLAVSTVRSPPAAMAIAPPAIKRILFG